ncbi:DUF4365 domain-containing protein [Myxococcus sp. CA056]|uniref:DUF4365 domain-containing protein n=1 Tax=unclassified Myxococcus TaxID=2648731 RepID=UPI00157A2A2D|nr:MULTISPECIES: DUF4365 domain-containing protein [unclassified Myxococcus]NTX09509.1 DUF4365 domain-containing protein [Myxococcus sp. CA056]NTX34875.1 DUF4365 domain-containing protein [Myxococcus sp. CA033]
MLGPNDIKEQLSIAYVHAVAARAGCSVERVGVDRDSIDLKVCARGLLGAHAVLTSPELAIQLKATAKASAMAEADEGGFSFPLSRKNYNDLVAPSLVPRILVVFVMPEAQDEWLTLTPESLTLRRCAYWTSLRGQPLTANETRKTVLLSREKRFTHDTLRELLEKVAREEDLHP